MLSNIYDKIYIPSRIYIRAYTTWRLYCTSLFWWCLRSYNFLRLRQRKLFHEKRKQCQELQIYHRVTVLVLDYTRWNSNQCKLNLNSRKHTYLISQNDKLLNTISWVNCASHCVDKSGKLSMYISYNFLCHPWQQMGIENVIHVGNISVCVCVWVCMFRFVGILFQCGHESANPIMFY